MALNSFVLIASTKRVIPTRSSRLHSIGALGILPVNRNAVPVCRKWTPPYVPSGHCPPGEGGAKKTKGATEAAPCPNPVSAPANYQGTSLRSPFFFLLVDSFLESLFESPAFDASVASLFASVPVVAASLFASPAGAAASVFEVAAGSLVLSTAEAGFAAGSPAAEAVGGAAAAGVLGALVVGPAGVHA